MKIAHWTVVTPGRCGLYETAREMVKGLRDLGIDSRLVDPDIKANKLYPNSDNDRGASIANTDWAMGADLFINHSGLGLYEKITKQPIIHICHGRPRYSFIGERDGWVPVVSYQYRKGKEDRYTPVTLWEEHKPYLEPVWGHEVKFIPPCVDLDFWKPEGPRHFKSGVNYVITDAWRSDIDPYICLIAFINSDVKAKLHVYGAEQNRRGWNVLFKILQDQGRLGEVKPWVKGLDTVYRSADALLTPHTIDTRAVREAMACGCPVIRVNSPKVSMAINQSRESVRSDAEFSYSQTYGMLKDLCFQVIKKHQLAA